MANSNPSPDTRFKPGYSGNPGGISSETRRKIDEARDKAADAYLAMVSALADEVTRDGGDPLSGIDASALKLLKDVFDRSVGTPKQSVDVESPNGTMSPPTSWVIEGVPPKSDDAD